MNPYQEEAKARWGNTEAYRESERKTGRYSKEDFARINQEAQQIFAAFAALVGSDPADMSVQQLVQRWQAHITKYYYQCTLPILAGLGEMYLADERFTANLDQYGEGTAQLMSEAIKYYCQA